MTAKELALYILAMPEEEQQLPVVAFNDNCTYSDIKPDDVLDIILIDASGYYVSYTHQGHRKVLAFGG